MPASAAALLLAAGLPARAAVLAGVDWRPLGRGDLAWIDAEQESGTLVAETDGLLRPALSAWGGWLRGRTAVLGGLAAASLTTVTRVDLGDAGEQRTVETVGAVRLAADLRRYLADRGGTGPVAYAQLGLYGVLPFARHASDAWTDEEQAAWDDVAREERARIAGGGVRAGLGAELAVSPGVLLGARAAAVVHRGQVVDDEAWRGTLLVLPETTLTLAFEFP